MFSNGRAVHPDSSSPTHDNKISAIMNCICPECGGAMGFGANPFQCWGECGRNWRAAWESPEPNSKSVKRLQQPVGGRKAWNHSLRKSG
jgi:hypothetical protein